ncbi:steroid transmembrane transporter SLC22A24-like [Haemaphysalis longicornis]
MPQLTEKRPFPCLSPKGFMIVDIETSEGFDCEEAFGSGHFQNRIVLFTAIANFVMLTHAIAFPLISTDVDHWCRQPTGWNLSTNTWKSIAIPLKTDGRYSQCTVYANPGDPNDTTVVECDAWDYDLERVNTSIVSEWNMVCNRRSLKLLGNAAFMAGSIVFLLLSGYIADTFGRLPVVLGSATVLMVATLASCFAPSYPVYLGTRFLLSGCTISLYAVTGTMLAEAASCARRSTLLSVALLMGHSLADTWTVILKWVRPFHWFHIQLLAVAPTLLVTVFFLLAVESPRWLIASRRLEAAGRVMRRAAELNRVQSNGVTLLLERVERRLKTEIGMDWLDYPEDHQNKLTLAVFKCTKSNGRITMWFLQLTAIAVALAAALYIAPICTLGVAGARNPEDENGCQNLDTDDSDPDDNRCSL